MLTREEAKKADCPYRMAAYLKPDETPHIEWYYCKAEACPKWRDACQDNGCGTVSCDEACMENNNPRKYGYCCG